MLIHAGSAFDNRVTFTFDLLTPGSMHTERLPCTLRLPSSVLIAQRIFLLEHGHTDTDTHTVTDATDHLSHALAIIAGVDNKWEEMYAGRVREPGSPCTMDSLSLGAGRRPTQDATDTTQRGVSPCPRLQ